ncbi:MAG: hypothetical protein EOO28_26140 [Comamonadaceae bacterium]|nr:MAG: hypothetical protein EOO28_26140 [Comamonadaceae bacterium]
MLSGAIGEELSEPLAAIDRVVQDFTRTRSISRSQIKTLRDGIAAARRIAMQSQQISRLAGGRLRQSHERLSLDSIVNHALDERSKNFKQSGIELYRNLKAVDIIVDPGLLSSLVDAAIDWASERAQRLVVTLEIKNWPENGLLWLKASQTIATSNDNEPVEERDNISWYLLSQIAQAMGVGINRISSPGEVMLMIEFTRTVKQLEGLTAVEVHAGGDSGFMSESKPMAGHRLLLVTTDDFLRASVKQICRTMGLMLDTVATTEQAVRFCEMDKPHMIMIDERLRDASFDELRADLHRYDPNLPFVEITDQPGMLEMASWVSGSMTRVSRDSVKTQLSTIIVFELAKVM